MTNQEIFALIDRFEHSSLHSMKLSSGQFVLELSRGERGTAPVQPLASQTCSVPGEGECSQEPEIVAPLVGTYYAAPEAGAPAFVSVGDMMREGQTVCLIEAMKMVSEIHAPCDCVITEILKENGTLAEFQEPLFRYRPC